jgi:hypothetical protein
MRHSIPNWPIVGYHVCEQSVFEAVLLGNKHLKTSTNDYDWLADGAYFWVGSLDRAEKWAKAEKAAGKIKAPAIIGAIIQPAKCLNLNDSNNAAEIRAAYEFYINASTASGIEIAKNSAHKNGISLLRHLDCAVIRTLHQLRRDRNLPNYDAVISAFDEGAPLFNNTQLRELSHIQIAVRDRSAIIGYFKPVRN